MLNTDDEERDAMTNTTNPGATWRDLPAKQQPDWPDSAKLAQVVNELRELPPLVAPGEIDALTADLARAQAGKAFVLQGGDCAEPLQVSEPTLSATMKVLLQMTMVLMYGTGLPVVKIGRMAGQFGKPRSSGTETRNGQSLPVFRGMIVNDAAFTTAARTPDPERLRKAYFSAVSTLNLIRSLTRGGFADLAQVHSWNMDFVAATEMGKRYDEVAQAIHRALDFMRASGVRVDRVAALHEASFYVSHEALILPYEDALTRETSNGWYDQSAHFLWIGERTRQLDHAHVAFLAGVRNPIGVKLGPTTTVAEVLELCERLNPDNLPGRLTLVARMGAGKVLKVLPGLMAAVKKAGWRVLWMTDPMHGNTEERETLSGTYKTRHLDRVFAEVADFFTACRMAGVHPGGLHLELTGENVTECLGGSDVIEEDHLGDNNTTMCDPRFNGNQSLDLALMVAEMLRR
jgi:3-deoxy-7-phosphoheptulonate synthase